MVGGYLVGVVAGPDTPERTTGEVQSYQPSNRELCLAGGAVEDLRGAEEGVLCGTWMRAPGSRNPAEGDQFRFVSTVAPDESGPGDDDDEDRILIFGEVDD